MNLKFWLDDKVLIRFPKIHGVINEIRFEGQSDKFIVYYKVQYWAESQMYTVEFTENELEPETEHPPKQIGFSNVRTNDPE